MAVDTEEMRELVDFAPEGFLVTSFYLNVDAREFSSPHHIQKSLDSALHTADEERKQVEQGLSHEAAESLRQDLGKIQQYVEKDFQRNDANGLAIFSCSGQGLWEVIPMPDCVDTQVVFARRPYLVPLATFLSHTKPTAILVTDRQQARILTMAHGQVKEWSSFEDYVPHRSEQGGWSQMRYQRRSDNWAKHHVDHATELVLKLMQHYPFDWLILGIEPESENDVMEGLHPYLKDRVIGTINVQIDGTEAEIIEKARPVREEAEQHLIDRLVDQIQEYAGAGGRGTIGLKDTVQAMNEQKVHILLFQQGFSQPGSVCEECGYISVEETQTCPTCNGKAEPVPNVVNALVQRAYELGSVVEVATEYDRLTPIECIGSIMYY